MTKKAKNENKPKKKAPKQLGLGDGYEAKKIAGIEKEAEALCDLDDEIKDLQKQREVQQERLDDEVIKAGVRKYVYDRNGEPYVVAVPDVKKPHATVKKLKKKPKSDGE